MLVCFILNVAAVVPQSVRAFTQDWKVGVRIPFATDFFRKNSTGYGRWRTCSTKLPRLTRVVAYRAVLKRKLNVGNNYVFASILYFFFHFCKQFVTTFVYLRFVWLCQVSEGIESLNLILLMCSLTLTLSMLNSFVQNSIATKAKNVHLICQKKLKKIIWMLRLHFLCFIRLLVLLYIMDVKYWVFMKAPYVEK